MRTIQKEVIELIWILLGIAGAAALVLLIAFLCFLKAFFAIRHKPTEEYPLPPGRIYQPYRERMIRWMQEVRAMPHEALSVTSFDGLTLRGNYYEHAPGAPLELMFPGYRGLAERDLCGGVQRAFALGHNALIVDQRACGQSEGRLITFGIREKRDCLAWIARIEERFGAEQKIILTGISMGAATVLMAAGEPLPKSVIGVLADCGYTTAAEMIQKTIGELHLPPALAYPLVRLGARLYGGFRIEEASPLEAVAHCTLPVIFFHGDDDRYVPCEMSVRNHETCPAEKRLVIVAGAGHGRCYPADPQGYLQALREFEPHWGIVPTER